MKKNLLFFLVVLIAHCFGQDSLQTRIDLPRNGLALYPFQKQIGYRGNLNRKWFSDFKGGMTFSALPFFILEYNRNHRFVNKENVKVYSGIGITLDSYVPGIQIPIGMEFIPVAAAGPLSVIVEVKPKISLGPTNFLNFSFSPHLGIAYYLKQAKK